MAATAATEGRATSVGMGAWELSRHPDSLYAVLGSCIGLAFVQPATQVGILAHIVLPDSSGRSGPPAKFADQAIPNMLEALRENDVPLRGLIVKMAGGGQMFNSSGPMQIGQANAEAVREALHSVRLKIDNEDVGGPGGRRVSVDCCTGEMTITRVGHADQVI